VLQWLTPAPVPGRLPRHPEHRAVLDEIFLRHGKGLFDAQPTATHEPDAYADAAHGASGRGVEPAVAGERQQDKDVNGSGKVIGYDMLYIVFNPKTETAKLTFTFSTAVSCTGWLTRPATR
jgi:hypothetical protein